MAPHAKVRVRRRPAAVAARTPGGLRPPPVAAHDPSQRLRPGHVSGTGQRASVRVWRPPEAAHTTPAGAHGIGEGMRGALSGAVSIACPPGASVRPGPAGPGLDPVHRAGPAEDRGDRHGMVRAHDPAAHQPGQPPRPERNRPRPRVHEGDRIRGRRGRALPPGGGAQRSGRGPRRRGLVRHRRATSWPVLPRIYKALAIAGGRRC
jgi:hypothetical protein